MQPTIKQLIGFIKQHSHHAFERDGRLYAIETGTRLIDPNNRDSGIVPYTRIVKLSPTLKAVRIWLGY